MGIPAIKLNLAPPATPWRLHHVAISWTVFAVGTAGLAIAILYTLLAYREADMAGRKAVAITEQARTAQKQQSEVLNDLREIKVDAELPRWRLAERILMERALPWSRITAELERSLVHNVRVKSIQRARGTDQTVQLKLRGESRSQASEAEFIESLQKNFAFAQVILEREAEIPNRRGSLEFDYNLQLNTEPPPYALLPKYGPARKPGQDIEPEPEPPKPETPPAQTQEARPATPQPTEQPVQPQPRPQRDTTVRPVRPARREPSQRQFSPGREGRRER